MKFKVMILYILFIIFMVAKTVILVNLVKKYWIDWGYIVGQLDAITTSISARFIAQWGFKKCIER